MRDTWYEVPLDLNLRVAVEFGGRPVDDYAVMLQVLVDDEWTTVFLVDNAHGTHHAHRYSGTQKGPAEPFYDGPDPQAIRYATSHIVDNAEIIVDDWQTRTEAEDG